MTSLRETHTGTPADSAVPFLRALFGSCPHTQFLEIRPLGPARGGSSPGRKFIRLRQLQRRGFDQAVPESLDGKANVFFGVLPRCRKGGKAIDVELASCLWADLDKGWPAPWPEGIPQPSIIVESSPGRFQCYWLLTEPTAETQRVSSLVQRLAQTLGGDNVPDLPRILRLPGFQNLKYPERPVAQLRGLYPDRCYTLDELEAGLPPQPAHAKGPVSERNGVPHGRFDPHAGGEDVPQVMLAELKGELRRVGAYQHWDGRLAGRCPFPHVNGPCDCQQGFYFSPFSGRWWCFCTDHPQRRPDKDCVAGGAWSLWPVLFPGRSRPRPENSRLFSSSPLNLRGGEASNSPTSIYDPPVPVPLEALNGAPRHNQSAELLRMVGQRKKAEAEATCGVPVKGKCQRHGIVRELRASGKTPWCAGCNTETSAKYLRVEFPEEAYSILRMQQHLGPQHYDAGEVKVDEWEIDAGDGQRIADLILDRFQGAVGHFKRVQRRFKDECLGWHFAVGDNNDGLWVEIQVLVRHSNQLTRVLQELTGDTRQKASFQPDAVTRYDYPPTQIIQLRQDWAGLLKCALLSLEDDVMFIPIYLALGKRQLCQAYGDLRAAYSETKEEEARNGEREKLKRCPVIDNVGQLCGMELEFFSDPRPAPAEL